MYAIAFIPHHPLVSRTLHVLYQFSLSVPVSCTNMVHINSVDLMGCFMIYGEMLSRVLRKASLFSHILDLMMNIKNVS